MSKIYDILILGGGPIGASTAYFLSRKGKRTIGIVTLEPANVAHATYQSAGGCVRWFWSDPLRTTATKLTADFIKKLSRSVDVSLREDTYLFLNRGKHVPAINISSAKLVTHFIKSAQEKGVELHPGEMIKQVKQVNGLVSITTDKTTYQAKKVLLALGAQNARFLPHYELEKEERYLMVLDVPIGENELTFPHTIVPVGNGAAYLFVKKLPEGWRFLLGQENVLPVPKSSSVKTHFNTLLKAGLGATMPFLQSAKVERMLVGTDVGNKTLRIEQFEGIYAANCGSAIRSCVWIGQEIAKKISH